MIIKTYPQRSEPWRLDRAGSIGGQRFSAATSGKKNRLIYSLIAEKMGYYTDDEYQSDDMMFGNDNEPYAAQLYSEQSGIKFREVGLIKSEHSDIHHASPDRLSECNSIVLEVKCTQNIDIQIQRYFEDFVKENIHQVTNYFVVSDEIKEVHLVSYCPFFVERPLVVSIITRDSILQAKVDEYRARIKEIEAEVAEKMREVF